jgi:hypothetical protein
LDTDHWIIYGIKGWNRAVFGPIGWKTSLDWKGGAPALDHKPGRENRDRPTGKTYPEKS